jgi:hypothetical protein
VRIHWRSGYLIASWHLRMNTKGSYAFDFVTVYDHAGRYLRTKNPKKKNCYFQTSLRN